MIRGSCLCGAVKFEVTRFVGPFEYCHCSRCRKVSGGAFASMVGVAAEDFAWISGRDEIESYVAPVDEWPPGYKSSFCRRCGSPMPGFDPQEEWFEIAAGGLDDDPELRFDRHIFVECLPDWSQITDDQPQLTKAELIRMRIAEMKRASGSDESQSKSETEAGA